MFTIHPCWSLAPAVLLATAAMAATPNSLTFTYTIAGAIPPPQSLSLSGVGSYAASASSIGGWLAVRTSGGSLPSHLEVVAKPIGLNVGSYTGAVLLTYRSGAPETVPVTLTVAAPYPAPPGNIEEVLTVSPSSLTFTYEFGGANPRSQSLSVAGNVGQTFTLISPAASGWLSTGTLSASSPASLSVFVNPAGLAAGTYSGAIVITSTTAAIGDARSINVTLNVSGGPPPAPFRLTSIVNAASFLASPVAPGEIISIFGTGLGPVDPQTLRLTPANLVDTQLGGTRVIINGKPSPILFAQADQVNTIVPYSAAGRSTIQVQVEYQGVRTADATLSVADAAPEIFTLDGSGRGQGAILNQDTSVNSPLNPATRGTIAVLYATGAGLMNPPGEDGAIAGSALARPFLPVLVRIDGRDAQVTYAGSAPGQVAGVLQVNFRVPAVSTVGRAVELQLQVGRFTSRSDVTISIR